MKYSHGKLLLTLLYVYLLDYNAYFRTFFLLEFDTGRQDDTVKSEVSLIFKERPLFCLLVYRKLNNNIIIKEGITFQQAQRCEGGCRNRRWNEKNRGWVNLPLNDLFWRMFLAEIVSPHAPNRISFSLLFCRRCDRHSLYCSESRNPRYGKQKRLHAC